MFESDPGRNIDQVACLTNAAMLKSDLDAPAQARRLLEVAADLKPDDAPLSYYVKRPTAEAAVAAGDGDLESVSLLMREARDRAEKRNLDSRRYALEIVAFHAQLLAAGSPTSTEQPCQHRVHGTGRPAPRRADGDAAGGDQHQRADAVARRAGHTPRGRCRHAANLA